MRDGIPLAGQQPLQWDFFIYYNHLAGKFGIFARDDFDTTDNNCRRDTIGP